MDKDMRLENEELEQVSGGDGRLEDELQRRQEKEAKECGTVLTDRFGNIKFTDKTGITGTFSAADWNKLKTNWNYTGAPDFYIKQVNVNELNNLLNNMNS